MCTTRVKTKDNNILLVHVGSSSKLFPTIIDHRIKIFWKIK